MFNFTSTTVISTETPLALSRIKNLKNVVSVRKAPYVQSTLGTATFTMGTLVANTTYRIKLVIGLSNSQMSEYSNALVFKEKPFFFEFTAPSTISDANVNATLLALVNSINKEQMRFSGTKHFTVARAAADKRIVFTMANDFQVIKEAVLEKYSSSATLNPPFSYGEFIPATTTEKGTITIVPTVLEFGGYDWILRNLRLPTLENKRWTSPNELEMPVPGAHYDQYIVIVRTENREINGGSMGERTTSEATHIFWVNNTLANVANTILGLAKFVVTADDVTLANSATATLSATLFGNSVTPTYTVKSGASATVSGNTVTAHTSTDGDTVITATYVLDTVTYTADITFTVA